MFKHQVLCTLEKKAFYKYIDHRVSVDCSVVMVTVDKRKMTLPK